MSTEQPPKKSRQGLKIGGLGAALAIAVAVFPSSAGAVIEPHVVKPQAVTAHVVPPSTAPSSSAGQSFSQSSAPSPSAAPRQAAPSTPTPAADQGPDLSPPEGLPNHEDPACDIDCKQEWYDYYDTLRIHAYNDSVFAKNDPKAAEEAKKAQQFLADEADSIGEEIQQLGGTPGEPEEPLNPPSAGDGSSPSGQPSQSDPVPTPVEPSSQGDNGVVEKFYDLATLGEDETPGRLLAAFINGVAQKDIVQFEGGKLSPVNQTSGSGAGPSRGSDPTATGNNADAESILGTVEGLFGIDGSSSSGSNGLHQLEQPQSAD